MTGYEYDAHMKKINGLCECCMEQQATDVDHCHDTNIIRGFLCSECNTGIGKLGDNEEGVERALNYLKIGGANYE